MDREETRQRLIDLRKRQAESEGEPKGKAITIHFRVGKDGIVRVLQPDEAKVELQKALDSGQEYELSYV